MERIEQLRQQVLVLKCQTGDRLAWEELYRQYNPSLGYYLRRLLGNDLLAEDVQQEVWLTVVRNIGRLKSPEVHSPSHSGNPLLGMIIGVLMVGAFLGLPVAGVILVLMLILTRRTASMNQIRASLAAIDAQLRQMGAASVGTSDVRKS